jgi:hypothetical protein
VTTVSNFTVVGPPTITSFSPTAGAVGTVVNVNGANFAGATAVTFGPTNVAGFFTLISGTQPTVTVPAGATSGKIRVTTPIGTATSAANFAVSP